MYIYTVVFHYYSIATQHNPFFLQETANISSSKLQIMTSSAKTCGVCSVSVAVGQGQAIFTADCSHAFHFPCISSYMTNGNRICPVCSATWKNLPFAPPPPPNPFQPFFPVQQQQQQPFFPVQQFPYQPTFNPTPAEPLCYNDDEPLPNANTDDHMLIDSAVDSNKVTIKVIPERRAVAASESVFQFAVLVGLKAPSMSDDARSSQRAPIDIVTVLDVSGSMSGKKLNLVKSAVHFVIDNLGVTDRLSVVSFSNNASRMLPLRRMTATGRDEAKRAVDSLVASGGTNIVDGLKKGAQVLEERRFKNPVTSIIFLSDGNDTYHLMRSLHQGNPGDAPRLLHMLPPSINEGSEAGRQGPTYPVHSFGFGSDHDPITMHAISDASRGTFSFIESYEMIQDAFAGCIGGLLSVVTQELRVKLRSASHGVEIKSIPSGRYKSEIANQGAEGLINVGELYADEEKEFLIYVSVPPSSNDGGEDSERKTSLLDITCSYKDTISKQIVEIEGDLVEIGRPKVPSSQDLEVNLEVDRQRNRVGAAESIKQAQQMAEAGNLTGATKLLEEKRSDLMATASGKAGDGMTKWLEGEMRETGMRMGSARMYQQSGRAYALSGMSSHANQRATSKGGEVAGASFLQMQMQQQAMGCPPPPLGGAAFGAGMGAPFGSAMGASGAVVGAAFGGYATPQMANMVCKSRLQSKAEEEGKH